MLMKTVDTARLNSEPRCLVAAGGRQQDVMQKWPKIPALALLSAAALIFGHVPAPRAATTSTLDILSNDTAGDSRDSVDIGSVKPLARPNREAAKPLPGGNPLWSVPLSALKATQGRPIFSASRRPSQPAVVAPPVDEQAGAPVPLAGPEIPSLVMIGAVVGDGDAIAVFFDHTNQKIVRLRRGETHAGWVLSAIQGREVTLQKAERTEILELKANDPARGAPAIPTSTAIGAGATDGNYAPFIPRSTPKNGESDGL